MFYPLRYILFALPIRSEVAISWYVMLHLILASITSRIAARWAGLSPAAATLTGIIYPLSGSVLFLYTNPPFLVAAAWLPLAIGAFVGCGPLTNRTRVVVAGTAMSMMILGGDPQTALHVMIMVGLVWVVAMVRRKPAAVGLRTILAAPLLAAALATPQLAASISWSRQSERILANSREDWIAPPIVGGRRFEAYQYSFAPWHTLELASPKLYGSLLPQNTRISSLLPGDGRTWTPSIYMGMLAFLAIVLRIGGLRREPLDVWLSFALVSLWLAMGHFGVVWLLQATTQTLPDVDSAIGGPYWWLYHFIPGYDSFRYPAKWLSMFAFAASIVTSQVVENKMLAVEERPVDQGTASSKRWYSWYFGVGRFTRRLLDGDAGGSMEYGLVMGCQRPTAERRILGSAEPTCCSVTDFEFLDPLDIGFAGDRGRVLVKNQRPTVVPWRGLGHAVDRHH